MDVEVLQLAASAYVMDIAVVSDIQSLLNAIMVSDSQCYHIQPSICMVFHPNLDLHFSMLMPTGGSR